MAKSGDHSFLKAMDRAGKTDPFSASLIMQQCYTDDYIADNADLDYSEHPLKDIRMSPAMDVITGNRRENMIRTYRRFKVLNYFGFNFDEFVNRPRHEVETILMECEQALKEESQAIDNIEKPK